MKRHLNRKKDKLAEIDPEHVAFWEKLFSTPFVTLLEHEPGKVSGKSTGAHTMSSAAALYLLNERKFETKQIHNTCIMTKNQVKITKNNVFSCSVSYTGDIITAFYFPLIPALFEVQLDVGGQTIARWTPEGSEFRCPPLPLTAILEECRGLPALHVDWERILAVCRQQGDYSRFDHDFGRDMELEGVRYRRAVLVHPCLTMVGLPFHDVRLRFIFRESEGEEFAFHTEYWMLCAEFRNVLAQHQFDMTSQSDTFEDDSNVAPTMTRMKCFTDDPAISDLGTLLKDTVQTAWVHSNLGTLSVSGSSEII